MNNTHYNDSYVLCFYNISNWLKLSWRVVAGIGNSTGNQSLVFINFFPFLLKFIYTIKWEQFKYMYSTFFTYINFSGLYFVSIWQIPLHKGDTDVHWTSQREVWCIAAE